jgi:hypothetical protein
MCGLQYSKYSQAQIVPNHILFKSHENKLETAETKSLVYL